LSHASSPEFTYLNSKNWIRVEFHLNVDSGFEKLLPFKTYLCAR
jgi:hypothetical protein